MCLAQETTSLDTIVDNGNFTRLAKKHHPKDMQPATKQIAAEENCTSGLAV
jgi:hypothetical protein